MVRLSLFVLLSALALPVLAGDTFQLTDSAQSKIYKPKGLPPFDSIAKQGSSFKITFAAPGVDPATFTADTQVTITLTESSLSPDTLTFKFSDDPKYIAGAKSVTFKKSALPPGVPNLPQVQKLATLQQCQIKFGKDSISITYSSKYLPFRAQSYINYGFLPNLVRYPEGPQTTTRTAGASITIGTVTKQFTGMTYEVNYTNKKAKEAGLWTGSAKGAIKFEQ